MKLSMTIICLACFLSAGVPNAAAAAPACADFGFAEALYAEGDYYRAITEYKRFLHTCPEGPDAPQASLQVARSYLRGHRWLDAEEALHQTRAAYPSTPQSQLAWLLEGEVAYEQKRFSLARQRFRALLAGGSDPDILTQARYRLAWSYLEESQTSLARNELTLLEGDTVAALEKEIAALEDLPHRSPRLAGSLSAVLPGAGQVYTGRYKDATLALVLNSAFILGSLESFDEGNDVTGAILAFFELGWYGGNIFNAVNSAHKFNRNARQEVMTPLRSNYGLPTDTRLDQTGLSLRLRF